MLSNFCFKKVTLQRMFWLGFPRQVVKETADLLNDQKKEVQKVVDLLSHSARRDDVIKALESKADSEEVSFVCIRDSETGL